MKKIAVTLAVLLLLAVVAFVLVSARIPVEQTPVPQEQEVVMTLEQALAKEAGMSENEYGDMRREMYKSMSPEEEVTYVQKVFMHALPNTNAPRLPDAMLEKLETPLLRVAQSSLQYTTVNVRINAPANTPVYVASLNEQGLQAYFKKSFSGADNDWERGVLEDLQNSSTRAAIFYVYEDGDNLEAVLFITNGDSSRGHAGLFASMYETAFPE
jgi:hypothetical protein